MKASFVDLRKKSSQIIKALNRNERITVLYRGKPAAIMQPIDDQGRESTGSAKDHAAFGMWADRDDMKDIAAHVRQLRRGRFDAL
ncbi:MAG: hypothetical protein JJU36_04765 [Phycisphaeraceae bacterium]|nr:hypothetical protein [Phycisphaeraceae bacterium]